MKQIDESRDNILQTVEQVGVWVNKELRGFLRTDADIISSHVFVMLCLQGTAHVLCDMQEYRIEKNDFGILMPGHILRRVSCSEDFTYACVILSSETTRELQAYIFSHDFSKFNYTPKCNLTDLQTKRMMALMELLEAIALHDPHDLQLRRQMLFSQIAVGYEFLNYYRREQDREWPQIRPATLYKQFCDLVVEHYKENRNVNFYANLMNYDARYFSKVFRQFSNLSPLEWIQRYVAAQAKRIMDMNPRQTVKETAWQLGFPTTANFCRYFKRATGIYPQEYKRRILP
ncbi:MAG: AraC family transcriptional regulator [Bacteroidales bacterium]|nr:AraC family transcriptional regulator [Bacteroidales bacterium]